MGKWTAILTTWALAIGIAAPAAAVVIFPKGGRPVIKAALVRQDADKLVYLDVRPDGSSVEREIRRDEIEDMIITVSAERLASLQPERPSGYRDYADELAEKREDPDARQTALRLYLIAAWLEPDRLGRSCLLGMAGLAQGADEERKYRAMAYLLDPQHDRRLLKSHGSSRPVATAATAPLPESLLKPLRLVREGKDRTALMLASRGQTRAQFDQIKDYLSYDQFVEAARYCHRFGTIPPGVLRRIIELELNFGGAPRHNVVVGPGSGSSAGAWSDTVRLGQVSPTPSLDLEHLTDMDPRKCVYRDGAWKEK